MTTTITTTRLWPSQDSYESIGLSRFQALGSAGRKTANSTSTGKESKKTVGKKPGGNLSRTSVLAVPKRGINTVQTSGLGLNGRIIATLYHKVKKSALLYEITDRTNRLVKPKTIARDLEEPKNPAARISLSKCLSQRVSELSRPRNSFCDPPTRPSGYVAPCALRAVATRRILELATPRIKKRSPRLRKKRIYPVLNAPCSSRISYLARPKRFGNCGGSAVQRNYLKRSSLPADANPPPWEFPSTRVWKNLGYSKNVVKRCDEEVKTRGSRQRRRKQKQLIKSSKSDDSVFSFSAAQRKTLRPSKRRAKKLGSKINRRKRR